MKEEEKRMTIRRELIDELLKECTDPKEILAEGGLLKQLTSALIERCLETEMEECIASRESSLIGLSNPLLFCSSFTMQRGLKRVRGLWPHRK